MTETSRTPQSFRLVPFDPATAPAGVRLEGELQRTGNRLHLRYHLAGDVYFKVSHPGHNLERALVQFQLTRSIEAQLPAIRAIVERLQAEVAS